MRNFYLYQVFDSKAATPVGPIFAGVTPTAIVREIQQHVEDKQTIIGRHPDDFVILEIAVQDQDTGKVTGHDEPQVIVQVRALVKQT